MIDVEALRTRYRRIAGFLDERGRRLFAANEALALGRGGVTAVSAASGIVVAAGRNGLLLEVHQAWRIYPLFVNIAGIQKPIDPLKAFANVYGADISIENETGRFFLFLSRPGPTKIEWHARPNQKIILSRFVRNDHTGREDSALVVAIDIKKYTSMLDRTSLFQKEPLREVVWVSLAQF